MSNSQSCFKPSTSASKSVSLALGKDTVTDSWQSACLESLFDACFAQDFSTVLRGNAHEPLYLPADQAEQMHTIFYRLNYFSSALHETAHWCIAGNNRRLKEDYGYWYEPDGRNAAQQQAFQQVEVKPQAIEMAFSIACGKSFRVSIDNLATNCKLQDLANQAAFDKAVNKQYQTYCKRGFPNRAAIFIEALTNAFSKRNTAP